MRNLYILDGQTPVPVDDLLEWALWMAQHDCTVAITRHKGFRLVTSFLGLNMALIEQAPIVFETMAFRRNKPRYQRRYATWDEAVRGHEQAAAKFAKPPPGAPVADYRGEHQCCGICAWPYRGSAPYCSPSCASEAAERTCP